MRRDVDFVHGICEFCRRADSAARGARNGGFDPPPAPVEVLLAEHISWWERLLLRHWARDLCAGLSRYLAYPHEAGGNGAASLVMRVRDHALFLCDCPAGQRPSGVIAAAGSGAALSKAAWSYKGILRAPCASDLVDLCRAFSLLWHEHLLTDAAGNELLCLCDDHRTTIPLSVADKMAYEAVNNHMHLLDELSDAAFAKLVADAPVLCQLIYRNIKLQYPQKRIAVYVEVSRRDSLTVRFHQVWDQESPYWNPADFASGDERIFSVIDPSQ